MAANKGTGKPKLGSSSTKITKRPGRYGYLIGREQELLPMSESLTTSLYGERIADLSEEDLRQQAIETRTTYAMNHSTQPFKIKIPPKTTVMPARSTLIAKRPVKGKEPSEPLEPKMEMESEPKAKPMPSRNAPFKGKEPEPEKKVQRQDEYPLVNLTPKGKATKIKVEQVLPRLPGEDVPSSSIRTEVGEIPTLDIKMKPDGGELAPEIVENPELIKPFAIQQKNIAILEEIGRAHV